MEEATVSNKPSKEQQRKKKKINENRSEHDRFLVQYLEDSYVLLIENKVNHLFAWRYGR